METTHEQMSEPTSGEQRARLTRPTEGRVLAGVAAGLADYAGIDPVIVRLGFVALTIFGGAGVLIYLVAALMIPPSDGSRRDLSGLLKGAIVILGLGLVFNLGLSFLSSVMGIYAIERFRWVGDGFGIGPFELLFAFALIAFGVYLLRSPRDPAWQQRSDQPDPPAPSGSPSRSTGASVETGAHPMPTTRAARRLSPLAPLTLAAAFVVVGTLTGFTNGGVINLDVGQLVAVGMAVLGAGLLVGTWLGRSRLLIIPVLLLTPVLIVTSFIDLPPRGSLGSRYLVIGSTEELADSYELLLGEITLDLSNIPAEEFGDQTLELSIAAGRAVVYVPSGIAVDVKGHIGLGEANLGADSSDGADLDIDSSHGEASSEGSILIDVRGGVTSLTVDRIEATDPFGEGTIDRPGRDRSERGGRNSKRNNGKGN